MEDDLLLRYYKYLEDNLRKKLGNSTYSIKNLNCEISKIKQQNIFLTNNIIDLNIENNKLKKHLEDLNIKLNTQTSTIKNYKLKILEFESIIYNNKSTVYDIYIKQQYNKIIYDIELENTQLKAELIDLKKNKLNI